MAQCTNRKELLRCSNIALNEIQTYPYTTIYYDIVKDSGDRSYYKLTKVTGKYYCNNSATKITSQTLRIGQTGWTSNGYREQTKDFDIPASQKNWTKYPDSSWAGVLVDATNHVGCYYVVNIAAKTGKDLVC